MSIEEIYSWIFLATALASEIKPAKKSEISMVADGINHAVPTHKEMNSSLNWLIAKGLLKKIGTKYDLTATGKRLMDQATDSKELSILALWKQIEIELKNVR
ncbi:hypothetical protein ACJD0Z_12210 [Flavobacteriaceae bacterium M23B6Z8]